MRKLWKGLRWVEIERHVAPNGVSLSLQQEFTISHESRSRTSLHVRSHSTSSSHMFAHLRTRPQHQTPLTYPHPPSESPLHWQNGPKHSLLQRTPPPEPPMLLRPQIGMPQRKANQRPDANQPSLPPETPRLLARSVRSRRRRSERGLVMAMGWNLMRSRGGEEAERKDLPSLMCRTWIGGQGHLGMGRR